jgi:hypothetical protein
MFLDEQVGGAPGVEIRGHDVPHDERRLASPGAVLGRVQLASQVDATTCNCALPFSNQEELDELALINCLLGRHILTTK